MTSEPKYESASYEPTGATAYESAVVDVPKLESESPKRSVTITLAGKRLALRTDADEAYVARLARLIEQRIENVRQSARGVSGEQVILLATLQLADELERERSEKAALKQKIREKSRSILDYIRREARL